MPKFKGFSDRQAPALTDEPEVQSLDQVVAGIKAGAANAVKQAHARGLPFFEADAKAVYAVYPDGRRSVIRHLQ